MEMLLLVLTIGALVFALLMSVLAWRLSKEERRRAAARVAQLSAEAAMPAATASPVMPPEFRPSPWRSPSVVERAPAAAAPVTRADAPAAPVARAEAPAAPAGEPRETIKAIPVPARQVVLKDVPPLADELTLSAGFLGTSNRAPESAGRQRGLAAAAAVLAVGLVAFGLYEWMGPAAQTASARSAAAATPLELLSLRHERVGSRLSVSGLVKNPSAGQAVERLYAVVFVFDQAGTFVTSGRAPVDFIRIAGGDESPFVVALDAPQNVARYRVSFRTDAGTVPHVDKRGALPVATPEESASTVAVR
jgi:hypothetical protein